jgi:hypothetical protein
MNIFNEMRTPLQSAENKRFGGAFFYIRVRFDCDEAKIFDGRGRTGGLEVRHNVREVGQAGVRRECAFAEHTAC